MTVLEVIVLQSTTSAGTRCLAIVVYSLAAVFMAQWRGGRGLKQLLGGSVVCLAVLFVFTGAPSKELFFGFMVVGVLLLSPAAVSVATVAMVRRFARLPVRVAALTQWALASMTGYAFIELTTWWGNSLWI